MNSKALDLAASKAVLGLLPSDDLSQVAVEALEHGCDSPSLRILSGLHAGEPEEARTLFKQALSELNVSVPNKRDAVRRLAQEIATEILGGMVTAYVGAKQIWDLTLRVPDVEFPELDAFVYAASEWEDRPEDRPSFEDGIVAAARELVSRYGSSAPSRSR